MWEVDIEEVETLRVLDLSKGDLDSSGVRVWGTIGVETGIKDWKFR